MSGDVIGAQSHADLRLSALKRLTGQAGSHETRLDASAAFGVLYELASSPSTAASALALLHELQVYQVELELQDEELRRSRAELEATLMRQVQIYDFAPVASLPSIEALRCENSISPPRACSVPSGTNFLAEPSTRFSRRKAHMLCMQCSPVRAAAPRPRAAHCNWCQDATSMLQ